MQGRPSHLTGASGLRLMACTDSGPDRMPEFDLEEVNNLSAEDIVEVYTQGFGHLDDAALSELLTRLVQSTPEHRTLARDVLNRLENSDRGDVVLLIVRSVSDELLVELARDPARRPLLLELQHTLDRMPISDELGRVNEALQNAPAIEPTADAETPLGLDVETIEQQETIEPGEDDILVFIADDRMVALPARGNMVLQPPPSGGRTPTPSPTPLSAMPTVGKEGLRLVNVGNRTAFALDAGGPRRIFTRAMAEAQSVLGVTSLQGVVILHIHSDHVRSFRRMVSTYRLSPENIHVPEAFLTNSSAPSSSLARAMVEVRRNAGTGARFSTIPTPSSARPYFHQRLVEGEVTFDMYGLTQAFRELQDARAAGQRQPMADRASLLVRVTHNETGTGILYLGDLRGADLAQFRQAMGGEYENMMRGVRVISGFQHHLGALNSSADRNELVEFLRTAIRLNGRISIIAQSAERYGGRQFLNRALIEALNQIGVDVHVVGRPTGAQQGSATIDSLGQVTTRGAGVETHRGRLELESHARRVDRLETAERALSRYQRFAVQGERRLSQVRAARRSLDARFESLTALAIQGVGASAAERGQHSLSNQAAVDRAVEALETEAEIETFLRFGGARAYRELLRMGPHLEIWEEELRNSRRTGRMSDRGINALWELDTRTAERLIRESGMSRQEARRVRRSLPGAGVSGGGRVIGGVLLAVSIFNEVAPAIAAANTEDYNDDVARFLGDILFWQSTGVRVQMEGLADNWGTDELTDRPARIGALLEQGALDALALTSIQNNGGPMQLGNWDLFALWARRTIRNVEDWHHFISTNQGLRSTGEGDERRWEYRTGRIQEGIIDWYVEVGWQYDERLTTILRTTFTEMVRQSNRELAVVESGPGPSGQTTISSPGSYVHRDLYQGLPQATGLFRFREDISEPELYTQAGLRGREVRDGLLLYTFPDSAIGGEVPDGYAVVGGADYNSYIHLNWLGNRVQRPVIGPDGTPTDRTYQARANAPLFLARRSDLVATTRPRR